MVRLEWLARLRVYDIEIALNRRYIFRSAASSLVSQMGSVDMNGDLDVQPVYISGAHMQASHIPKVLCTDFKFIFT